MARENEGNTQGGTQSQTSNIWTQMESQPVENIVWGRLYGKNIKVKTLDLCHEKFAAGRGEANDMVLTIRDLPEKMLCRISKVHFTITRENCDLSKPVYIQDCSRNGTFVNGERIGFSKTRILKDSDIICLAHPKCQAFMFKDSNLNVGQGHPSEINNVYHVCERLGAGGCGTVWLAYDRRTCIKYAMKHVEKKTLIEMKSNAITDPERVLNEAKIMKSLEHPCIIKLYDIVDKPDSVYMILEFMGGGDLLNRICTYKRIPEPLSKLYFYQMCHAVKYLHDKNITHRDIKPDNILLNTNDKETLVKVSDFGLSKFVRQNSVMRTHCGTPQYAAPEVLLRRGYDTYTKKVDIWSLGVVLYTCLSGTLPFHNNSKKAPIELMQEGELEFEKATWKTISQRAKSLITEMLTLDPNVRPSIDYVLAHSWLRDAKIIRKAKTLMNIPIIDDVVPMSDDENFIEPPQKRIKR